MVPQDERPRISRQIVMITGSALPAGVPGIGRIELACSASFPPGISSPRKRGTRDAALLHPKSTSLGQRADDGMLSASIVTRPTASDDSMRPLTLARRARPASPPIRVLPSLALPARHVMARRAYHARANRNPLRRYWQYISGAVDPRSDRPAGPVESATLVAGLRAVSCCLGALRLRRRNGEHEWRSISPGTTTFPKHASSFSLRETECPDDAGADRSVSGDVADSFWADGAVRVSGRR